MKKVYTVLLALILGIGSFSVTEVKTLSTINIAPLASTNFSMYANSISGIWSNVVSGQNIALSSTATTTITLTLINLTSTKTYSLWVKPVGSFGGLKNMYLATANSVISFGTLINLQNSNNQLLVSFTGKSTQVIPIGQTFPPVAADGTLQIVNDDFPGTTTSITSDLVFSVTEN